MFRRAIFDGREPAGYHAEAGGGSHFRRCFSTSSSTVSAWSSSLINLSTPPLFPDHQLVAQLDQSSCIAEVLTLRDVFVRDRSKDARPGNWTRGRAKLKGRYEFGSFTGLCRRSVIVLCKCKEGAFESLELFLSRGRPVVGSRSGKGSSQRAVVGEVLHWRELSPPLGKPVWVTLRCVLAYLLVDAGRVERVS